MARRNRKDDRRESRLRVTPRNDAGPDEPAPRLADPPQSVPRDVDVSDSAAAEEKRPDAAPRRPIRRLGLVALGVFAAAFIAMAATARDVGLTWDEPAYLHSARGDADRPEESPPGDRHARCGMLKWFSRLVHAADLTEAREQFAKQPILEAWDYNRYGPDFHPPLSGMLASVGYLAAGRLIDEIAAWRLASAAEFALAIAVLFHFLARRHGAWVGGTAAASLALMPRVVGDGHIFGTDMPVMTVWALTALAFWKAIESGDAAGPIKHDRRDGAASDASEDAAVETPAIASWRSRPRAGVSLWPIIFGVMLGACFVTKFSAMLVVLPLGAWLIAYRAIPRFTAGRAIAAVVATALIAAPLALAAANIVRLSREIQRVTYERMLSSATSQIARASLDQFLGHAAPFSDAELKVARNQLAARLPPQPPTGLAPADWQALVDRLEPDKYIHYVNVLDLGVEPWFPGWIVLLPLPLWLVWSAAARWTPLRGFAGAGLSVWLAGLAIAPAVAIALNPTWWHDTLPQLAHYYQISAGRAGALPDIEIFYLGKKYLYSLPWHNGWVLIAVTVPLAILAIVLVGIGTAAARWRRDPLRMFFVLNALAIPLIRMLPTPAHDGVRLMLPTFFFLAGLAGWGFALVEQLVERFRTEEYSTVPVLGVAAAFLFAPPAFWLMRTHPHELSYYNGLVGGLAGAERRGFEQTYWYDAVTPAVLRKLNDSQRVLPVDATLMPPDAKNAPDVFGALQAMGKLRADIRLDTPRDGFPHMWLLTHSSKASPFTRLMFALEPRGTWLHDGVRLFSVYDPVGASRAFALTMLLDVSAPDPKSKRAAPRADVEMIEFARRHSIELYAAAVRVTEDGIDAALARHDDATTRDAIRRLTARRAPLETLLERRKEALVEVVEILSRTAEKRPDLLRRIIERDGYLPQSELGEYLDAGFTPASR